MSDTDIDLDNPNAIGVLDRLITNIAISIIAVFPTLLTCIATPWRLTPLLSDDRANGRDGMWLAPGAFFPLAMLVALLASALVVTEEIVANNGAFLGPGMAMSIQAAVAEGDIWQVVAIVTPIYGFSVVIGALALMLRPLVGAAWTLRVSLRAVFYVTGVLVAYVILSSAVIDAQRAATGNNELAWALYNLAPIPAVGIALWMYLWFFRRLGAEGWVRCAGLSVAMLGLKFGTLAGLDAVMRTG